MLNKVFSYAVLAIGLVALAGACSAIADKAKGNEQTTVVKNSTN